MKLPRVILIATLACLGGCAPGIYREAGRQKLTEVSTRIDNIEFEIWFQGELIWRGSAKVNRSTPANQILKITEADLPTCQPFGGSRERQVSIRFYKFGGNYRDPDVYKFEASITHGKTSQDCGGEPSRSSRAERTTKLGRGQDLEVNGEDGLRMIVRRP